MKLNDFLNPTLLGRTFIAVRGYSEAVDHETQKLAAYRLNVSIQDENSPFYLELIDVKVNNLNPTVSVHELVNNKTMPVEVVDLNVGQYNGTL
ncbi:hypothetical protein N0K71_06705 [Dellaglioa algida]|nr:hypothetical protein [Dellaglioa algida]MDK1733314.1 hypothetical protein [Dellaglioa algida]MDK1734769.1 hypothetical protein [Dellaglioa algida]